MLEILLISAGAVLETLFIMRSYKRRDVSSVVLKTAASVVFVLLGLLAAAAATFVLQEFVWTIEVEGNDRLPAGQD
mgnify:CR=1 FL=1